MTKRCPFKYFKTSPKIIRLAVMLYVRFPRSLRKYEDLLHGRGVEISHETVRIWWHRFGPMLAAGYCQSNRPWPPFPAFFSESRVQAYVL